MIEELLTNCLASLTRVLAGLALAIIFGVILGFLRSSLPHSLKKNFLVKILFDAPKFPPPIAWIPFVIIAFGIGEISSYIIVFIGAFSPIFTSTFDAAERIPTSWRDTANSLELRGFDRFFKFSLQACLPKIISGIRSGASMGWMSVIAAEMISGQSGLGHSIQLNRLNLQYSYMIIDMLAIGIIGYLIFELMNQIEKRVVKWKA